MQVDILRVDETVCRDPEPIGLDRRDHACRLLHVGDAGCAHWSVLERHAELHGLDAPLRVPALATGELVDGPHPAGIVLD